MAQSGDNGNLKTSIAQVKTFDGSAVIPYAGASLSRNNDGVFMSLYTSGLTEGSVVTLWWAIFNNPKVCATPHSCGVPDLFNPDVEASIQYAGGSVIGVEQSAKFGGFLAAGDNTGFQILPGMPNPAPGIINTKKAEIHLVIRTHGQASTDPGILMQQLTTFNGGCPPNLCVNIQAARFSQ
jgi:hypothetical protein